MFIVTWYEARGSIGVPFSHWLLLLTLLLALFLTLGKRRAEIVALEDYASMHRPALAHYSATLLDQLLATLELRAALIVSVAPRAGSVCAQRNAALMKSMKHTLEQLKTAAESAAKAGGPQ